MNINNKKYIVVSSKKNINKKYYYLKQNGGKYYFAKQNITKKETNTDRMLNEINVINLLSECHITPKIIDYDVNNQIILFDFQGGNSLKDKIYDIDYAIDIILKILDILEIIHSKGYIYGDIKPSNFIIDGQQNIHFIDFECTIPVGEELNYATDMYCSPYQKENRKAKFEFDFYSLGVMFLELLIGYELVKKLYIRKEISDYEVKKIILNIPLSINNIIKKLLSNNVENNYKNVLEIKNDIYQYKKTINSKYIY